MNLFDLIAHVQCDHLAFRVSDQVESEDKVPLRVRLSEVELDDTRLARGQKLRDHALVQVQLNLLKLEFSLKHVSIVDAVFNLYHYEMFLSLALREGLQHLKVKVELLCSRD